MHLSQHALCTRKMELALELKFYLGFHWVTLTWRRTLTNESDVKYVFPLTNGIDVKYVFLRCPARTSAHAQPDLSLFPFVFGEQAAKLEKISEQMKIKRLLSSSWQRSTSTSSQRWLTFRLFEGNTVCTGWFWQGGLKRERGEPMSSPRAFRTRPVLRVNTSRHERFACRWGYWPFHFQECSISNFLCSLTRNITSHSM